MIPAPGGEITCGLPSLGNAACFSSTAEFVSVLDLSDVAGPGDVAVVTGAYTGNAVAGAVTRFEEFQVSRFNKDYGPASGKLELKAGVMSGHSSRVWTRDLITEATFTSPPGRDWYHGFKIRNPENNRFEVISVNGGNLWFHQALDVGDDDFTIVDKGRLSPGLRGENHLMLLALDDFGLFFVNGELVARLDLSHNLEYGGVNAIGAFFNNLTGGPSFEDFNVWTP